MKYRTRKTDVPPYHWLYTELKIAAKNGEKSLDLTFEDFLTFIKIQTCHYCSGPVAWSMRSRRRNENGKLVKNSASYNLDRKDNDKGYSVTNCVVCCPKCNAVKGNTLTYDEMLLLREGLQKIRQMYVTQ